MSWVQHPPRGREKTSKYRQLKLEAPEDAWLLHIYTPNWGKNLFCSVCSNLQTGYGKQKELKELWRIFVSSAMPLESYAFNMNHSLKGKMTEEDQKVVDKCGETITWLENNQLAVKEEYQHQQKELVKLATPLSAGCIREECLEATQKDRPQAASRGQPLRKWTQITNFHSLLSDTVTFYHDFPPGTPPCVHQCVFFFSLESHLENSKSPPCRKLKEHLCNGKFVTQMHLHFWIVNPIHNRFENDAHY